MPDPNGWEPLLPHVIVWPNDEPEHSGLVDANGYSLIHVKSPVGFIDYSRDRNTNRPRLADGPRDN